MTITAYNSSMDKPNPGNTVQSSPSLYQILEAAMAGKTGSFLVLDGQGRVIVTNERLHEFIKAYTSAVLYQHNHFVTFLHQVRDLSILADAVSDAFHRRQSRDFVFAVVREQKRWYRAEIQVLDRNDQVEGLVLGLNDITAQKTAEETLKKSESLFKTLVQNSADVFLLADKSFRFTYISDGVFPFTGYHVDDLVGKSGLDWVHDDDKLKVESWFNDLVLLSRKSSPIEFRLKNSKGMWIYVECTGHNMLADKNVNAVVIKYHNIQAKKIADLALVNAEQRLTMLLNNTKESFIILNNRLRIIAYNKAAQEHSPYFFKRELQSGLSILDFIPPMEILQYIEMFEEVLDEKEKEKETNFIDDSGQLHIYRHIFRSMRMENDMVGIFITSTDITEMKKAELALKDSEIKFRTLVQHSFDAIMIMDEHANIVYVTPSINNLLGYEPEEIIKLNGFEYIHEKDNRLVKFSLSDVIENASVRRADFRMRHKAGNYKWIEGIARNMVDNKYIRGILVSLRDISERKRLMEEQAALTEQLLKHNKDLQQFSFITSHNLRAPVANLISLLSLYNRNDHADPFNAVLMEKFQQSTNQLNETLNDLINVLVIRSRPNADIEYLSFQEVFDHVQKDVQNLLSETGGKLVCDFTEAEGVEYNKIHLESIFLNLVTNGVKYASPGRPLVLKISSSQDDKWTMVSFSDNGIGIDLDRYKDRMFGLYQRFHANKDGKGLGLYMIKSQITAFGGKIEVKSNLGEGTTFTVYFKKLVSA